MIYLASVKKHISSFLFSIIVFSSFSLPAQDAEAELNQQLRALFSGLSTPAPYKDYLYEMAVHYIDTNEFSVHYDTLRNDTNFASMWLEQYKEVRNMAYDISNIQSVHDFGTAAFNSVKHNGQIPIGIIHSQFYRLKEDALTTNNYFDYDTLNTTLVNRPGVTPYAFYTDEVFSAAPLAAQCANQDPVFLIDKNFFLLGAGTTSLYNSDFRVVIDFDDGYGEREYDPTIVQTQQIHYSSPGRKYLKIGVKPLGANYKVASTNGTIRINENTNTSYPHSPTVQKNGLSVTIADPCTTGSVNRKVAIIVEGFDFAEDQQYYNLHQTVVENTHIKDLKNFGYEFHLINWNNSKLDMRTNAKYLIEYMDEVKCELLNSGNMEPMVVIGHSMGGVVANYVLTKWEHDPGVSACHEDYLHFTRLLITLDSPHKGANIPLAYQHLYSKNEYLLQYKVINNYDAIASRGLREDLLESVAARQLLMYHVDMYDRHAFPNYKRHSERTTFVNDLAAYGGRPSYCKVMATSCGSASGRKQYNIYENRERKPEDKFLHFTATTYTRVLIWVKATNFVDFKLESAGKNNIVFSSINTLWSWKIGLKLFGFKIKLDQVLSPINQERADIHSYDVESGGNLSLNFNPIEPGFDQVGWPTSSFPAVHAFRYSAELAPGKWFIGAEAGFGYVYGKGVLAILHTDGFDFSFVPLRSALNYGGSIYDFNEEQSPNLYTYGAINNTPFDVILAVPDRDPDLETGLFNYNHSNIYSPPLYWKYSNDPQQSDPMHYRSCFLLPTPSGLDSSNKHVNNYIYLLSREIGDDQLYLENFTQVFPQADYQAEYDVYVNKHNPAYQYMNYTHPFQYSAGAFSKSQPFETQQYVRFIGNTSNAQQYPGRYETNGFEMYEPEVDDYDAEDEPYLVCCNAPPSVRKKSLSAAFGQKGRVQGMAGEYTVYVPLEEMKNKSLQYELRSVSGSLLKQGEWNYQSSGKYELRFQQAPGVYFLKITNGKDFLTFKIMNAL